MSQPPGNGQPNASGSLPSYERACAYMAFAHWMMSAREVVELLVFGQT